MDTPTNTITSADKKLYTKGWIFVASYIGGPLAGCYLMSKNFQTLGDEDRARTSLLIGVAATLLLLIAVGFLLPQSLINKMPRSPLIPIIYTLIIDYYVQKTQGAAIAEHLKNGGQKQSGWKVVGVALASLALFLGGAFALFSLLP